LGTYYADGDGDGFGAGAAIRSEERRVGKARNNSECNDGDVTVNPNAAEVCNGKDDDCDGLTDDADGSVTGLGTYYADGDGDGFGAGAAIHTCSQPAGTSLNNSDCNDGDVTVNPNAAEVCNGKDDDCDGLTDDADGSVTGLGTYYADGDGDGFGAGAAI